MVRPGLVLSSVSWVCVCSFVASVPVLGDILCAQRATHPLPPYTSVATGTQPGCHGSACEMVGPSQQDVRGTTPNESVNNWVLFRRELRDWKQSQLYG